MDIATISFVGLEGDSFRGKKSGAVATLPPGADGNGNDSADINAPSPTRKRIAYAVWGGASATAAAGVREEARE